jgi:hypothetical protein
LKHGPQFFRWHVSGDIPNQAYLNSMMAMARMHTDVKFFAFTKHFQLDYRRTPSNLTIIFSMWPGMRKPRHKKGVEGFAWMQDGTERRVPKGAVECHGTCETCGMCFDIRAAGGHVVFHKH